MWQKTLEKEHSNYNVFFVCLRRSLESRHKCTRDAKKHVICWVSKGTTSVWSKGGLIPVHLLWTKLQSLEIQTKWAAKVSWNNVLIYKLFFPKQSRKWAFILIKMYFIPLFEYCLKKKTSIINKNSLRSSNSACFVYKFLIFVSQRHSEGQKSQWLFSLKSRFDLRHNITKSNYCIHAT